VTGNDLTILRDLVKQYMAICAEPVQAARRALWRDHNSLIKTRSPILVSAFAFDEMPEARCLCEEPRSSVAGNTISATCFFGIH